MISIEDVIAFFRKNNPDKSISTYTTMKYNIIRLQKITEKDIDDLNIDDLSDTNFIEKQLEHYALNTKIQSILGIKLFLKYKKSDKNLIEKYNDILKEYIQLNKDQIDKNEMTYNESKNWIDYKDLIEKYNNYYENNFLKDYEIIEETGNNYSRYNFIRNFLLLSLFIELPPTRIGNYQFMKIKLKKKRNGTSLNKDYNYLMINDIKKEKPNYSLVFNKYKTSRVLGQVTHDIEKNSKLEKIISMYIIKRNNFINNKTNNSFLLAKDKTNMTQSNITDTLKYVSRKIINKELSANLFRHIFLTYFFQKNISIEEKKHIARFIGQSYEPSMMEKYKRIKPEPINIINEKKTNDLIVSFD